MTPYRQILSALEPMQDPPPTPPSSLTGRGDTPTPSDPPVDDSLNDYIHRLETLQARLGSGNYLVYTAMYYYNIIDPCRYQLRTASKV